MGNIKLLAEFDWSKTELGPISLWPDERRAVVETAMQSTFPICLAWGDDLIQVYNDGYNRFYGEKHPRSFGAPAIESWPEIWDFLKTAFDRVKSDKKPHDFSNLMIPIIKAKTLEECYFSFCYSPIFSGDGSVAGVMSIAMETTSESISERRRSLTTFIIDTPTVGPHSISEKLREMLRDNELDAKAAWVFRESTPQAAIDWAIRCSDETAEKLFLVVKQKQRGDKCGVIPLDEGLRRTDYADFLSYVTFPAADGKGQKTLVLWPSALVTEESVSDLIFKLAKRLQIATQQLINLGHIKEELVQSDLLYRFLFENTLDGVIYTLTDMDGRGPETIVAVNKAICDMLGYDAHEMVGMLRDDFFFADDDQLTSAIAERAQQNIFEGDLVFRHKSGRPLNLEVTSILAHLKSGQRRSISLIRDLSKKIHAERERGERSRLETIAQMTGGISHDFNNFLTVILNAAEYLSSSITDADQGDAINDILTASNRAANLTSQLLAYSKKQNLHATPVNINSAIQEVERLSQSVVGRDLHIHYDYSRRPLGAVIDVAQFTSALVNLIKNASDAMCGRGRITVSTRRKKIDGSVAAVPPGNYITISVEDQGSGISPKLLQKIFDPFFTTKSNIGGSGLGLSMVQGFARQSGGDISIISVPGRGTTATLYIPFQQDETVSVPAGNVRDFAGRDCSGEVLIVDDAPLIRRQVGRIIKSLGMRFIEAGTGAEAIELIKSGPKLVITDLRMPGSQTGADVAEACKRAQPEIPVILITGFPGDPQLNDPQLQAVEILPKPFSRNALIAAVGKALGKRVI